MGILWGRRRRASGLFTRIGHDQRQAFVRSTVVTECAELASLAGSEAAPSAEYELVNPHDAEVGEGVQITQFRTVGSAGTSPAGLSCRGD